jgi:hypothetical protein
MRSIFPVRELLLRSNCSIKGNANSSDGRLPDKLLKSISRKYRLDNLPISVGIDPCRPPCSIPKSSRLAKSPISVGILPTKLLASTHDEVVDNGDGDSSRDGDDNGVDDGSMDVDDDSQSTHVRIKERIVSVS